MASRELVMARGGACPGPLRFGDQPVTNIRNVTSPHWRGWLGAKGEKEGGPRAFAG